MFEISDEAYKQYLQFEKDQYAELVIEMPPRKVSPPFSLEDITFSKEKLTIALSGMGEDERKFILRKYALGYKKHKELTRAAIEELGKRNGNV